MRMGVWGGNPPPRLAKRRRPETDHTRGVRPPMAYPMHKGDPGVPASPDLPEVERAILDYWSADATFEASVEQRSAGVDGANEFVFYDGPPFANGLPHYGHLLTGYAKD